VRCFRLLLTGQREVRPGPALPSEQQLRSGQGAGAGSAPPSTRRLPRQGRALNVHVLPSDKGITISTTLTATEPTRPARGFPRRRRLDSTAPQRGLPRLSRPQSGSQPGFPYTFSEAHQPQWKQASCRPHRLPHRLKLHPTTGIAFGGVKHTFQLVPPRIGRTFTWCFRRPCRSPWPDPSVGATRQASLPILTALAVNGPLGSTNC